MPASAGMEKWKMPKPKIDVGTLTERETIDLFDACLDAFTIRTVIDRLWAFYSTDEREQIAADLVLEERP